MIAPPRAMTATTKHEAMNTRIVFFLFCNIQHGFQNGRLPADRGRPYSDMGKRFGFNVYESSSERTHGHVKVSQFGLFEIKKKTPDPGREVLLEKVAICTGLSGNAAADETRH